MNILRQTIGLVLIILAWVDPFSLGMPFRIVLFVLGFDMLSLMIKVGIFISEYLLSYFFGFGVGIGWILILLLIAELVTKFLFFKWIIDLIIKEVKAENYILGKIDWLEILAQNDRIHEFFD